MNQSDPYASPEKIESTTESGVNAALGLRSLFGGVLMGLANLVPGISGGTMLLAAGVYPDFIESIANLTRFKFKLKSIVTLGCVVAAALVSILLFAGLLKDLVIERRWVMYSLFIGLTLGGLPLVWRLARPVSKKALLAAGTAFGLMVLLAWLQHSGFAGSGSSNFLMMFVAGLAGASAMILPGVSGGYLLLLLGQYVPILSGIDQFKTALKAKDISAAMDPAIGVVLPVGIGVVVGVVVVGNLLKWLLENQKQATLGVLLGLLLGSTIGLWPFQRGVQPKPGDIVKGQPVTAESLSEIDKEDWPTEWFNPSGGQIGGSLALIGLGLAVTWGVSMLGEKKDA